MPSVDLNADLGEGFGRYSCGDDAGLMQVVTSANIACGFHAGDPEVMATTFALARQHGVNVGAHPGYPDLWGFGRRRLPCSASEVENFTAYQIGAAQAMAALQGLRLTYVKAHGALNNLADVEPGIADAISRAIRAVDPGLAVMAVAGGAQWFSAERAGLAAVSEIYADRGYQDDGRMIARGQPGALIHDPLEVAARVRAMVEEGAVIAASGKRIPAQIDSICLHGDGPEAVAAARKVREALEEAGITLAPFRPQGRL